jgi:hypothetical protein
MLECVVVDKQTKAVVVVFFWFGDSEAAPVH